MAPHPSPMPFLTIQFMKRNTLIACLIVFVYVFSAITVARWLATPIIVEKLDPIVVEPQAEVFQLSAKRVSEFDRGANAAFDTLLDVLSDFRAQHKNPTWLEVEREAARRIQVHRREWFLAAQPRSPR